MTSTEQVGEQCHRCHGTGIEPAPKTPTVVEVDGAEQRALLVQLKEAGERRAAANRHTAAGRTALDDAYADIRAYAAEAERLHLTRAQVAAAVGVARAQLYNILSGKVGG